MEVINLPNYFKPDIPSPHYVYDYQSSIECMKQMVALQQNTFSFLIEGRKEVFADKTNITIENSNFLLMKMGTCLMTEKPPTTLENYRSILFFFSNKALLKFIQKNKIEHLKSCTNQSIYSFQYDDFLATFVQSLIQISKLETQMQSKLLELKFEELMTYLIETKGLDFIFSLLSNINSHTQHFNEIIEANKLNKLTINELAFLSNMSVSSFKREFEKQFKSSPSKWFQDQRLEYAAFMLRSNSKRPSDIYEEVGYENLSNFIQAFKNKFGITPKKYQLERTLITTF